MGKIEKIFSIFVKIAMYWDVITDKMLIDFSYITNYFV